MRVTYPHTLQGRSQRIVYVEFGDEETMKVGLEKNNEVFLTVHAHPQALILRYRKSTTPRSKSKSQ